MNFGSSKLIVMESERIRVAVRVRPSIGREEGSSVAVKVRDDGKTIDLEGGKVKANCTFDKAFAPETTQAEVWDYVKPSVEAILKGINCTIFAYGQTSSGKTTTMIVRNFS